MLEAEAAPRRVNVKMAFKPERMKELRKSFPIRRTEEFRELFPDKKKTEFSQQDIASICNTTQQRISLYERGKERPDVDMLSKLADVLRTSMDYLMGRTDSPVELSRRDLTELERSLDDAIRRGSINADILLLAEKFSQLPDPVRNELFRIAGVKQK